MNCFRKLLLSLTALVPTMALSQTAVKIAPLPTGADLSGVAFTSPDVGWIVGDNHVCFKTTDQGLAWTEVTIPGFESEPLYNITFVNAQLGFISGNAGTSQNQNAFRTTDGGATWQVMADVPAGSWSHMKFVSTTTGFMGANGALIRTVDAGETWSLRSAYPDCPIIYGMDFLNPNTGIVGGYQISSQQGGIFKTTDGGLTWQLKRTSWGSNDAIFLSSTVALADEADRILRSDDGGENWFPISTVPTGLMDMEKVDSNTVVGVSAGGDVWRSSDGGYTWSQRWIGVSDLPADWMVRFSDPLNGHVVGQAGTILETRDGGVTWAQLNRGASYTWNGIVAFSETDLLLVGYHGAVQTTNDAGLHWTPRIIDPPTFGRDTEFLDVAITSPNTAVACGAWGGLFKTYDRGTTWLDISGSVNPGFYPYAVTFTDANNGWITGFDYNNGSGLFLRRTQDGGASWQPASLNVPGFDIEFIGQTGYLLTSAEALYKTTDGGGSWQQHLISVNGEIPFQNSHMAWVNANTGYIAGWYGFLARTTDGGVTWSRILSWQDGFLYTDVAVRGPTEIWVCGARNGGGNAVVMRSIDNGVTWRTWSIPGQYEVPMRIGSANDAIYVTTFTGAVWRFDLSTQNVNPSSFTVFRGTLVSGNLASLFNVDQNYVVLRPGPTLDGQEAPIQLILDGTSPSSTVSDFRFNLVSHADEGGILQSIELFDWLTNAYVLVDTRAATTNDSTVEVTPNNPGRFVQTGTKAVRAKLSYRASGPLAHFPFAVSIDRAIWRIAP